MRRGRAGLGGESPSHPEARPDALPTLFGAQGAADVVLSPVGIFCLQVLTHLHGADARGGRRRRGGGGDIAAPGGLQARRGAPRLLRTSGARAAAILPRLRPCWRRRRGGSLGGGLAGGEAGGMLDYSFLARRAIMPLIWCGWFARSRAGKGQTNSILVGVGSALGSEDVGGVGGLLLDLGAFFAGELPPKGQVGGFLRRPSPLYGSAVAARV